MSTHVRFLDNISIEKIKYYSGDKNIEIEIRFKITQGVYFQILKLLENHKIEYKKSNFIDWIEVSEGQKRLSIRKRLFEDNTELWVAKENVFFKKFFNYDFNVSISKEKTQNPVYPLKPSLVRISERVTFRLFSLQCDLTKVIQRESNYNERVFFELEIEASKSQKIEELEKVIYICLKLVQQSFVNPFEKDSDERTVYTTDEKKRVFSKLNQLGLNYKFLAKPRDINFSDFSQNKLLNPDFEYRVTRKADGERRLLVFFEGVWLVGFSAPRELQLVTRDYDTIYEGIVLDGELVESAVSENLFIPFDAICNKDFDKSICREKHQVRLSLCQIISDYFKNSGLKYFSLMTKDFLGFETAEDFFSVVKKILAGGPYLKYKSDGILFVPNKVEYTKQDIIKWKPHSRYTIDVRYKKGFWYSSDNHVVNIPVKIQSLNVMDGDIVELRYNPDQKVFTETRIRFDKPLPNKMNVIRHVLKLIKNPITEETLKGKNNMIFLKKFHNRVKKILIDDSVKRLQKYFRGIELLDVGTGKGADINKWSQIDQIYVVEPDKQRVEELKKRLKSGPMKKVKIFNERIENIDFKHHVNFVTLFNVLTLMDKQGLERLVELLKRCVMYQGEIAFLVFDGNVVNQVFTEHQKNHGAIFKEISFDDGSKIKYEGDNKIFIHIPDSLVENQTEFIFYPDEFTEMLLPEFTLIKFDHTAGKEKFLSVKESIFNFFYAYGFFKRMDDDKEEIVKLRNGKQVKRIYCLFEEQLPELHPILKSLFEDYRNIKSGHYNRYNYGLKFLKRFKDLHTIAYKFKVQIELLDESGNILNTFSPQESNKKITLMKNMLIEYI
jgi:16S rRNA G527 N7-methylase RsmG